VLRRKALKRWTTKGYISKLAPCTCRAGFKDILCKSEKTWAGIGPKAAIRRAFTKCFL
tara:strand:+ start:567 stop:740 length:174 start_codon:yes stop_codon:yes gene_type:complete